MMACEPWKQRQGAYVKWRIRKSYTDSMGRETLPTVEQAKRVHGDIVRQAYRLDYPVPPKVLTEYGLGAP